MDSPKLLENHRPVTYIYNYCDGRYFIFALEVTYFIFALVKSQLDGKSSELNISLAKGNPSISSGSGPSFCHIIFLCICYISCDFRMLITAKLCIKRSPIHCYIGTDMLQTKVVESINEIKYNYAAKLCLELLMQY